MKRSEIEVGQAYYYDRSTNWPTAGWGGLGTKAVVVDDKRYRIERATWGLRGGEVRYREDPKGTAVLVDLHRTNRDGQRIVRDAVLTAHLRGPWEQTLADVTAARAREREASDAQNQRIDATASAVARAGTLGVAAERQDSDGRYVRLTTTEFARRCAVVRDGPEHD